MHTNHSLNSRSSWRRWMFATEMHENCVLWWLQSASFTGNTQPWNTQAWHTEIFGSAGLDLNMHYPNLSYLIRILLNPSLHCVQSNVSGGLVGKSLESGRRREKKTKQKQNSINANCIRHADNRLIWNKTSKQTEKPVSPQVTTFVLNQ